MEPNPALGVPIDRPGFTPVRELKKAYRKITAQISRGSEKRMATAEQQINRRRTGNAVDRVGAALLASMEEGTRTDAEFREKAARFAMDTAMEKALDAIEIKGLKKYLAARAARKTINLVRQSLQGKDGKALEKRTINAGKSLVKILGSEENAIGFIRTHAEHEKHITSGLHFLRTYPFFAGG